jgi:hypothetical protein
MTMQLVNAPQPFAASKPNIPNTCSFLGEHLQLIFDMRRDMVDKLHRHNILSHHLDALFDSISGDLVKRRFPTCCQLYVFTPALPQPPSGDGTSGSPSA